MISPLNTPEEQRKTEASALTDQELQQAIDSELIKLGFESIEDLYGAAKRHFAENGLKTTFDNNWEFEKQMFEHLDHIVLKMAGIE